MKKKILMAAAVIFSMYAQAQQDSAQLDEVVVTATKLPTKQSQTGKLVTVITRQEIERQQYKNFTDLLNQQVAVFSAGANNAPGSNQDVYIRGAATYNTLVLLDGVPVADPSYINNYFDFNGINLAQVERIEILKGAQSTLWGSNAVAAVINIITKKTTLKKVETNAMVSYGSFNTLRANAGVSGKISAFQYNLSYGFLNSNGFSSAHDSTGKNKYDDDGIRQHNVLATIGYKRNHFSSVYSFNLSNYTTQLDDGAFADDENYEGKNKSILHTLKLAYEKEKFKVFFVNSINNTKRQLTDLSYHAAPASTNDDSTSAMYKGFSLINELYGQFRISKTVSALAGIQHTKQHTQQQYEYVNTFFTYISKLGNDSAKMSNSAVYLSLSGHFSKLNVEAGIRYNNHNRYGSNSTFSFNPSYAFSETSLLSLNISSAFTTPSLYQLYGEFGNRQLEPEKSLNYEIGFQTGKKNSIRLALFKRDIKNLIIFYSDPVTYASQYRNRDEQQDKGFEVETKLTLTKNAVIQSNLAWVEGEGKSDGVKTKNLYRRPKITFNSLAIITPIKGLQLVPVIRYVGKREKGPYDLASANLDAYLTADFSAAYQVNKIFRAFADARNIFDKQYFDVPGYNTAGRNFTVGVLVKY